MKLFITAGWILSKERIINIKKNIIEFSPSKTAGISLAVTVLLSYFQIISSVYAETTRKVANQNEFDLESNVTLNRLIEHAIQSNPKIMEAREAWKATIEGRRIATGLPDPQFMVTYFPEPIETRNGPQDWNASLSQAVPYPGKLVKAGEIVDQDSEVARLNLDKTIREAATNVRIAFYELSYIREAQKVAANNIELIAHLRKVGETLYSQDQAALIDIVKAQSQEGQLQYDILLLNELEMTEVTNINSLLNRPPQAEIGRLVLPAVKPPVYGLSELYDLAKISQEDIKIKEAQVSKAEIKVDLAKDQRLPDFKVGVFYAEIGSPDDDPKSEDASDDAYGLQFGFTVPIWFGKNKSRINQALAERSRAVAAKKSKINDTHRDIHSIYFRLQNALRLVTLYKNNLLPQAARTMEMAETLYREKQTGFSDFIEAQSTWYNFNLAIARATADYGKYLARLEKLIGHSITERIPLVEPKQKD
ncbi:MAG: TolC family protein [Desulfobacterales bacterium]|nr:TolC family protein [Desulfobacterales bacterium]MDJ0855956.1 TolC family protein [Desulfobacterales bacterium]MDJ0990362.1 TolC family protein [Desulfobacterales bacterium]